MLSRHLILVAHLYHCLQNSFLYKFFCRLWRIRFEFCRILLWDIRCSFLDQRIIIWRILPVTINYYKQTAVHIFLRTYYHKHQCFGQLKLQYVPKYFSLGPMIRVNWKTFEQQNYFHPMLSIAPGLIGDHMY